MIKFVEDAKDVHVRAYVVFGKASDNTLYEDAELKTAVTEEDLNEYFKKGLVISVTVENTTTLFTPVSITGNIVSTVDTVSAAVAIVEWTAVAAN